jgi:hypothetical protein
MNLDTIKLGAIFLGMHGFVYCTTTPEVLLETKAPVEASASIDKAVATTGDVLMYAIRVDHQPELEVTIPDHSDQISGFRIIDMGIDNPEVKYGRVHKRRWYKLRADLVGSYILPPVQIAYDGDAPPPPSNLSTSIATSTATSIADLSQGTQPDKTHTSISTSEIFVEIKSVLPKDGQMQDIRGLKPLYPSAKRQPWTLIVSLALLVLVIGLFIVWRWRQRRHQQTDSPPPPHEAAFAALNLLRATDFENDEELRDYYFSISEVLRNYIEGRFELNATDLTREEILVHPRIDDLSEDQQEDLSQFLFDTDQVKYACSRPSSQNIAHVYETALSFIEATIPTLSLATEDT